MRVITMATAATVLILFSCSLSQSQTESDSTPKPATFADIGTWRITRLLYDNDSVGAIGDVPLTKRQVSRLIGRTVKITKDGCEIDPFTGERSNRGRVFHTDNRSTMLHSEHIPSNITLGLPENPIVFQEGCNIFWLRTDGNLVTVANDNYHWFEFERVAPPDPKVVTKP